MSNPLQEATDSFLVYSPQVAAYCVAFTFQIH